MLKRLLLVAVVSLLFIFQATGSAWAIEMDESLRTVVYSAEYDFFGDPIPDSIEYITLTNEEYTYGEREFVKNCGVCHKAGTTKPNPNVTLSLKDLQQAYPPRDNVVAIVDYLNYPMGYDGEEDLFLEVYHPNTSRPDIFPSMRNYTDDDLQNIAGYILVQPELRGILWGGGKVYN